MAGAAALVVLAYAPILAAGFVWDDVDHVAANPRIERWSAAREYFSRAEGRYHRPLVFLSYAAEYQLWGRSAAAYHATNVGLHLLNALLLAVAVRRCGLAPSVAVAAALLFGLHPVQTEAVAYVSGRTDLLVTCGALSAWVVLLGAGSAWRRGAAAALAAVASALAKESGYALALLVPWLAWRRETRMGERVAAALPTLMALSLVLALRPAALPSLGDVDVQWSRLAAVGSALLGYASLLAWPATLMVDRLTVPPATTAGAGLALAALAGCALLVVLGLRRGGTTADWIAWSVAFYLPVANLVALYPAIAERALFTPEHNLYPVAAGLAVLAAVALGRGAARLAARRAGLLRYAWFALLALLAARTALRAADWRDEKTLFGGAVAAGSRSPRVHYNLGNALLQRDELAAASGAFESAVRLAPGDGRAWANLGIVRQRQGDLLAALEAEERAATLLPADPVVRENLAALHLARGDLGAARAAFAEALRLDPTRHRARRALQALEAMAGSR